MFNFLFCICCDFFRTALFSEKLPLLQSNYFDTTVTFLEQLFFQGICFFLTSSFFQNNHFFAAAIFSEQLLFQSETSTEQPPREYKMFFAVVTFRNSYLFGGGIVQTEDIYRRATFSKQLLLQSINFFRRATFWKKSEFFRKSICGITHFFLES